MAQSQPEHVPLSAEAFYDLRIDGRCELVAGEVVEISPVGFDHGDAAGELIRLISNFARDRSLGRVGPEVGFILARDPDTVRAPDVAFLSNEKVALARGKRGFLPFAPDLAVEVLSPDDTYVEVDAKVSEYLAAGTRLVWVVNPPARRVVVHAAGGPIRVLNAGDVLDGGDVLPGFQVRVGALFE
jgi:Uma2 family endonuclease